ncbi:MAG: hypothetical protein COB13_003880 [OCS116 cluster bacterium]|uniref:SnoaL-like domain-containing protein n=1 Tax=OCS116 cluster bacterium TaxID=2030921 RepID=A0A2A4YRQ8_9PROT|nr:hypothetical protein [OCS116 cluster bacterium]
MSHNSKIIDYFYREFKDCNIDKIYSVVSPDFACYVNGGEKLSYEKLAERMGHTKNGATVTGEDMVSGDDIHFSAEFEVQTIDGRGEMKSAFGFIEAKLCRGLIESLNIHYHASDVEVEEFRDLIKNNASVMV